MDRRKRREVTQPKADLRERIRKIVSEEVIKDGGLKMSVTQVDDTLNVIADRILAAIEGIERIYIECPYCKSDIQQDERVECQCGWIAECITPDVYNHILALDDELTHLGSLLGCELFTINNLRWLEIQSGKDGE